MSVMRSLGVLTVMVACVGCAPTTPAFDRYYGESVKTLMAEQVIQPNASVANQNRIPEGLDGRSARETMERYQRSFTQPARPAPFVLGIGGGSEASSQ